MYGFDMGLMLLGIAFAVLGMIIQYRLKSKIKLYSEEPLKMSGKEVAEKMLRDNGIYDVQVTHQPGFLTDHYNPATKVVNLSEDVYNGRNIASAAIAAHECGHAVQHASAYAWLTMRTKLVPVVQISSTIMNMLMFAFFFMAYSMPHMGNTMLLIVIICQAALTLFSVITLPVEVDASRRGLQWLDSAGITYGTEHDHAKDALTWAAYTYFAAALGAIASLIYLILRYTGSSRD